MENILVGKGPEKERFYLKELQEEDLDMAVTLCDRCVGVTYIQGKNLLLQFNVKIIFFIFFLRQTGKRRDIFIFLPLS